MEIEGISKRRNYAKQALYQNSPNELKIVDQMATLLTRLNGQQQACLTAFLNPGQRAILRLLAGDEVAIHEFGGYPQAEKKRVWFSGSESNPALADYQLAVCQLDYPVKFAQLTHGAILGSLANLGVETDTFGDIITDGAGQWQFLVKADLTAFFQAEVTRVGKTQVRLRSVPLQAVLKPVDDSITISIVVASLRLDAVLAGLSKSSRTQIKAAISDNLVKLNWHSVQDSNIIVKVDDVLSLRHFGRSQIRNIKSTKKGKYKVVLKLWQTKKHK
ncbi:RNA-binding protein [Lactobacillus xylocopicola]|uniref:RNA-binding protein n=1 Tax=Lactobacillus xylocopicola TaxID=2976676 RepID=A0ABM8BGM1_9LACO|nr:YlmH/Sll1252 family protein [Lactobacillus xylocopicola]BDR60404.1 RNA-binding protein [Lactobacillus xylocopicola]